MDARKNPYRPGAGLRPPVIAGREADFEEFEVAIDRLRNDIQHKSIVFWGLRGVGKTILLRELDSMAMIKVGSPQACARSHPTRTSEPLSRDEQDDCSNP